MDLEDQAWKEDTSEIVVGEREIEDGERECVGDRWRQEEVERERKRKKRKEWPHKSFNETVLMVSYDHHYHQSLVLNAVRPTE